ncbi:DUF2334 domain-containing protein [Clostridium sp. BL-8]|uniref:DUF2334 domain-containing protein n=1 Tax=Clostridium sp. BL-8 TaxID=349938 RepID=UPI00241BF59A|nr:DUF2334 domain-containing protein [Clostridium sp. BL-8]
MKSPSNSRTLYVPTPLGYVEGKDGTKKILKRINNLGEDTLASLFYHPYIDFDHIILQNNTNNGYSMSNYSKNSPLHQIVQALYSKGGSFKEKINLVIHKLIFKFILYKL